MTDRSTSLSGKRIARAICWLCLASLILLPSWSAALGLGQLRVDSALNQRLEAEIELLAVQPGDLDTLEVRLATQSLEGNINARSVEFNYRVENRDGRTFIRLFSSRPIREPLLNFLVELSWQQGRLLRELAIFLDPPSSAPRTVAAAPPSPPRRTEPTAPPPAPTAPQFSTEEQAGALIYGPVRRGETLWAIASRARPGPEVSVPQMIQVIYEANPRAFARRSPDTLMAGVTLRIPAVAGQPPRQPEAPAAPSTTPAPAVAARTEPAPDPAPEPAPVAAAPPVEPESSAEVRLLPPDDNLAELADDFVTEAPARGAVIASEAGRPSLRLAGFDELRTRVQRLEQQGLLSARTRAAETPSDEAARQPAEPTADSAAQPEQTIDDAVSEPAAPVADEIAAETPDAPAVEPAPTVIAQGPENGATPSTVPEDAPAEPATAQGDEPVVLTEAPAVPQQGFDLVGLLIRMQSDPLATLGELRSRPLALPLLGGVVVLLLLLVLLLRRSRRRAEQRDEAELQQALATPESASAASAELTRLQAAPLRQRANRIDRVDFLLAAGSYREAENLVRLALVEDPDNTDLRIKMLEIHHQAGNADKFVEAAEALHQRIPDDSEQWQRVRAMGQSLVPGKPLFEPPASMQPAPPESSSAAVTPPPPEPVASEPAAPAGPSRKNDVIEFRGFEASRPRQADSSDQAKPRPAEPGPAEPDQAKTTRVVPSRSGAGADDLLQRLEALRLADDKPDAGESEQIDKSDKADDEVDEVDDEAERLASELDGKLIRAAACLDRGDYDNARNLLDEVLLQGDSEQQAQARAMLSRMD